MSISVTLTESFSPSTGSNLSGYTNAVGNTLTAVNYIYASNVTANNALTIAFNASTLQQIFLISDKGMILNFNNANTPLITLQPGIPFSWTAAVGYFANPFNTNVVNCLVTTSQASRIQGAYLTP